MRKKYDYHLIISYYHLDKEFSRYCKKHKKISFNRLARSFLIHKGIDYKFPYFEVENVQSDLTNLINICKTKWL